jgi:hypothetical protein
MCESRARYQHDMAVLERNGGVNLDLPGFIHLQNTIAGG